MLETVGLKPTEERVYWTLVRLPAASPVEVARALALAPEESSACLHRLESKGLASRAPDDPRRFQAAPPNLAFGPLLARRHEELRSIEAAVDQMTDEYRSRVAAQRSGPALETVRGAGALRRHVEQLWRGARRQLWAVLADVDLVGGAAPPAEARARLICPRSIPGDPYGWVAAGADVRLAPAVPLTLLIVDRSTALVPVPARGRGSGPPVAALVHRGPLLDALAALFESVWEASVPVPDGPPRSDPDAPDAEDLRLLSLLLAGLTDDAIASKLGLSRRTVQRRVHHLIELAGVRTRLQLAWESARRGWL